MRLSHLLAAAAVVVAIQSGVSQSQRQRRSRSRSSRFRPVGPLESSFSGKDYNTRAWTAASANGTRSWPEFDLPEIMAKPSIGIAFSGGGSRAYISTLATIAALRQLGLWEKFRYMSGVSGGSWGVAVFAYAQHNYCCDTCAGRCSPGAPYSIDTLLGPIQRPQEITMSNLKVMIKGCAREAATWSLYDEIMRYAIDPFCKQGKDSNRSCNGDQLWTAAVSEIYLRPVGIVDSKFYSWNENSVHDAISRNLGALAPEEFILPTPSSKDLPYPLMVRHASLLMKTVAAKHLPIWFSSLVVFWDQGVTVLGPRSLAPYPTSNRSYSQLELSPLYVGAPVVQDIEYVEVRMMDTSRSM
eukprot:SAG31_NODE_1411_length_8466_cov_18.216565_8_plen_355_part_00